MLSDDPDHGHALGPRHLDALADVVEDRRSAGDEQGPPGQAEVPLHVHDEQSVGGHVVGETRMRSRGERRAEGGARGAAGAREKKTFVMLFVSTEFSFHFSTLSNEEKRGIRSEESPRPLSRFGSILFPGSFPNLDTSSEDKPRYPVGGFSKKN